MDAPDGFYFSSSFSLRKTGSPFSIGAIINQIIKSEILPDRKFVWNRSLVYTFNREYLEWQPKI